LLPRATLLLLLFPSFFDIVINGDNIEIHKQTVRQTLERASDM